MELLVVSCHTTKIDKKMLLIYVYKLRKEWYFLGEEIVHQMDHSFGPLKKKKSLRFCV